MLSNIVHYLVFCESDTASLHDMLALQIVAKMNCEDL